MSAPLIRPPRRPAGWRPGGPPPADPAAWAPHLPREDEDLCYLTGEWRIVQKRAGHRYSLDDLATAWFAARQVAPGSAPKLALDLGCGIGSVLMMVAWRFPSARGIGIEAQDVSVDLARRSLRINGAAERCQVIHQDFREVALPERFDLVTGTPPYIPLGDAVVSAKVQRGPCRHEFRGGVEDYCAAAARHLAPGGAFVVCQAAADDERVSAGARAAGLAIRARMPVVPREGRAPLFSLYAMTLETGARAELPPLVVRDAAGNRTPECLAMREEMGIPP